MATVAVAPSISVEEYLRRTFEPDAEYVDGAIAERPLPEFDHAQLQIFIGALLLPFCRTWEMRVAGDARIQTGPTRFRLPDVCLTRASAPREDVLRTPPVLCVEILSPEDRPGRVQRKCEEYFACGVLALWIVDAAERSITLLLPDGARSVHRAGKVTVPGTPIEMDVAQAFSMLDY